MTLEEAYKREIIKYNALISTKNVKTNDYNGIYDRHYFFGVAESSTGIDGFVFKDYPIFRLKERRKKPMYMIFA